MTDGYDNSASSLFPAVVPHGKELPELQRSAGAMAKWADRQVQWSKHTHIRLTKAETQASEALGVATKIAESLERDRADRRRMFAVMLGGFTIIATLLQLLGGLWFSYRADQRERERDARDLAEAVERARGARPVHGGSP